MKDKLSDLVYNILNKKYIKNLERYKTSFITKISDSFQDKQMYKSIKKKNSKFLKNKTTKFNIKNTKEIDFQDEKNNNLSKKNIKHLKKMIESKGEHKLLKELSKKRKKCASDNCKNIVKEMNWVKLFFLDKN